ncbi:MAG: hypothetical protein A2504_11075 [Bdellovibrionales bacterium RIFOXYD12_FULL_39_22]|nr:MAG: hypothetical protein A2385_09640 [Bdellovibrionales bacterium RIFOXYB1_FULL_39_21]OFZ44218.1 MAG: hypothetical protein A2485_07260 [Bdellovibrionales bacterium RIFOXYC12_FULL_39_17]OFZ46760.1 MAG: hypothetical protein A2404_04495 [Bdellovibrionales bacterium RIFOXYC1_FULL_39_130]OFZ75963.1 MAG: hypothetical protein A2560_02655 [Bdellovibrionales bacterium RIFOXYD1_FULL_39_84]OFZ95439.1 MAG: hypothetical protein A2504_11075 [Bdellovibrionales bacterium RIFOXYD12_FULL_39_22]HLE09828.1 Co
METKISEPIAILGISDDKDRYSYKAYEMLLQNGYNNLVGITPKTLTLPKIKLVASLAEITTPIHTLTLYVSSKISELQIAAIVKLHPKRIIMNPGTENPNLEQIATQNEIEVIHACTLVLLRTSQF